MLAGFDYFLRQFFDTSILFIPFILTGCTAVWYNNIIKENDKEKNKKIEEEKQVVFNKLNQIDQRINEMYENGDIKLNAAQELKEAVFEVVLKNTDINHEHVSLFF